MMWPWYFQQETVEKRHAIATAANAVIFFVIWYSCPSLFKDYKIYNKKDPAVYK